MSLYCYKEFPNFLFLCTIAQVSLTAFLLHPHALASLSEPPGPWTSSLQVCLSTHPWRKAAFLAHPCSFFRLGHAHPLTLLEMWPASPRTGQDPSAGDGPAWGGRIGPCKHNAYIGDSFDSALGFSSGSIYFWWLSGKVVFLSRGNRYIGVAFQSHPVGHASSRVDRKSTRLNSSHKHRSRMPSSA